MNFKLTRNLVYYGARAVPFTLLANVGREDAGIPLTIDSTDDLDLEAIKSELRETVFRRGWRDLKITHTPAHLLEVAGLPPLPLEERIIVSANGVDIIYTPEENAA